MGNRSRVGARLAAAAAVSAAVVVTFAAAHGSGETATTNLEQAIPNLPGKSLIAVVVYYAPGAASAPQVHARSAFIYGYVLAGAIESQVNDAPRHIVHAGESFL